jgi:SAM-dependent methyltransferase
MTKLASEFHTVFDRTESRDAFFRFLQVVFHLYPEDKFHHLIHEVCGKLDSDEAIYREVQRRLPEITPFLSVLTYALPALRTQKKELTKETLELLGERGPVQGYLEIGSTGRYVSELRKHLRFNGPIYLVNDIAPTNSPGDIMERGQLSKLGQFIPLDNYKPISPADIPDASLDLATIYIGFHHCPLPQLPAFIDSIRRTLRPGGTLIVRDHDVRTPAMASFVSLVHTVFNLGLGATWEVDAADFKGFRPIKEWSDMLTAHGFTPAGKALFQPNDPSDNALIRLTKN